MHEESRRKNFVRFLIAVSALSVIAWQDAATPAGPRWAGLRSSVYGIRPFPSPDQWGVAFNTMTGNFDAATPVAVWIVGPLRGKIEGCLLEFPGQNSANPKIAFAEVDRHEEYLRHFDSQGVKVFLQVEPGFAEVDQLIDLVLTRYKHHPCVAGFGIDVEWYKNVTNGKDGVPVTDSEVQAWDTRVKSHNPAYRLFVKHFNKSFLCPTYRGDVIFVDDSQQFNSYEDFLKEMAEFSEFFYPNTVLYQTGYRADKTWWSRFDNPVQELGRELAKRTRQECGIVWVDFTARDVLKGALGDSSSAPVRRGESVTEVRGRLYLDGQAVTIRIRDGLIDGITRDDRAPSPATLPFVAPGLIDNQVNGYLGVAFTSDSLDVESVRKATQGLWKAGVTTYLPTLTTHTRETLLKSFATLARAMKDPALARSIPGFHLEGPYISPVDGYRGAHNRDWVRAPDWEEFQALNQAAGNRILQVSLAPEVEGATEFIRRLTGVGVKVGLAHHNGSAEIIKAAVDEGAGISTHLGNGCANLINRHENPLWPQLADDRLAASIIADGFHLTPAEIVVFFKAKGPDNLILTSDIVHLAGMPPGEYRKNEQTVVLAPEGVVRLPAQNVLAGAASALDRGVENFMRFTGSSLADAIHLATRNPARFYNLTDRGEIAVSKRADLILFTLENGRLSIVKTILAGEIVFDASSEIPGAGGD